MNEMTESDVEEFIEKAIDKYFDKGWITDAIFWRNAIDMLKKKLKSI